MCSPGRGLALRRADLAERVGSARSDRGDRLIAEQRSRKAEIGMSTAVKTERTVEASPRVAARMAGGLYLLTIVLGIVGVFLVDGTLVVNGDAAATATNVLTHETLFRVSFAAFLIGV